MVSTRKLRQAQKLQEQQISKALLESKPSTSHKSFEDDDDYDDADNIQEVNTGSLSKADDTINDDDDDDDAPIEVVSNKTSRKQATRDSAKLKAQEKAEKAKRQAAEQKRLEKQKTKAAAKVLQIEDGASGEVEISASNSGEEEGNSEDEAGSSNRLDPSLFAEVFAQPVSAPKSILKKRSAEERADEVARLQRERKQRRKEQRAGGVVKGRDGLPMKRAEDGTVLRALSTSNRSHKTSFDDEDEAKPDGPLDDLVRPTPLDPSASLPNAKARAFKKRSLAKKGAASRNASSKGSEKSNKDQDDPLGLNDPAFLPGGEFYHLVNKGGKAKVPKQGGKEAPATARQAFRGGGVRKDAVSVLRARSRGGPSLGFARSQQDSDDDY